MNRQCFSYQFLSIDHTENLRGDCRGGGGPPREIRSATKAWTETVDEEMGPNDEGIRQTEKKKENAGPMSGKYQVKHIKYEIFVTMNYP